MARNQPLPRNNPVTPATFPVKASLFLSLDRLSPEWVKMYNKDGTPSHYASNPPVGSTVKFISTDSEDTRYGFAAMLTDMGPNHGAEAVLVSSDHKTRAVFFIPQILAWQEIGERPLAPLEAFEFQG